MRYGTVALFHPNCSSSALRYQRDHRMEGCPFRVRRRVAFEPCMRHRRQVLVQLVDKARLADSGFAEDDDVLALAVLS